MRVAIKNFTGGEISETLLSRYDLQKYANSLLRMENFFPNTHSNAVRRSGMRYVASIGKTTEENKSPVKAVLMPFVFSTEEQQSYVISFKDKLFSVYNEAGIIAEDMESPYVESDLYTLSYAQVGDTVYIAHKEYALHKLTRSGEFPYTWEISEVVLNRSISAPNKPTVTWTGGKDPGGTAGPTNYKLRYKVVSVDEKGLMSVPSTVGEVNGRYPTEWIVGDKATISWNAVEGATEYNIYRESAGYYGYIGTVNNGAAVGGTLNGILFNGNVLPILKYAGSRSRTIIIGNGHVADSNTVGDITVANGNTNAFYDSALKILFVFVTETITTTRHYRTQDDYGDYYWTTSTSTSYANYWAVIGNVPRTIVGTYSSFVVGTNETYTYYPKNQIGSFDIKPSYNNGGIISFIDNNYEADTADTPQENWFPFADGNNPSVVSFHQQRMVLAGTKNSPQTVYMSRTGDFENFRKSRPLQDDDPVEYSISSGTIDDIKWVASFKDLLIGTSGAEYSATGADGTGSTITAKGINISPQSFWGSSYLQPIVVGTSILHSQRYSSKVRDLFYSLETDGYNGSDLTTLTPHLFEGYKILQWAFQQSPDSILWCVRDDGVLLAMSYIKEQQIVGWSVHKTNGKVKSVCRLSGEVDRIFVVVEREAGGEVITTLEFLENNFTQATDITDAFFVDCGVTLTSEEAKTEWDYPAHLAGFEPVLLADGSPVESFEVYDNNTKFKTPYPVKKVHIGLNYQSILGLLPFNADTDQGSTMGLKRGYGECSVKIFRTVGGMYGTDISDLTHFYEFPYLPDKYNEAVMPFSGDLDFTPFGGQDELTTLYIIQDKPLPMQILGIVVNIDFGQQG